MPDTRKCCILGICCVLKAQEATITGLLVADGMEEAMARRAAECLASKIRHASKSVGLKFTAEAEESE